MFRRNFEGRFNNHRGHMMNRDGFDFGKGFGGHPGRDRFFKKGNLQLIILKMLKEEPKHGYQVIKDLEERFKGFYAPSPGSVYPILQMLEDRDFVSISKDGNKKVYTITDEGETFLNENIDQDEFTKRLEGFQNVDIKAMEDARNQLRDLFKEIMLAGREAMEDDEKKAKFESFINETKEKAKNLYKN
ncbi:MULTISPECIES: PadR family transcriptional regulator [Mammaliicoccus]|uniref:PadR family transcriptional regulator n=3 Tax=Staphylococcaceae TaxID=90964 RepID=UPI000D1E9B3D|nr:MULTISPECIES: PadR family transcriptional regulator [Mammaliicoccus]MEB6339486.1 PadR family transcriptional regulator [Mammaliicoccus sciuri]MEB6342911.1 PadR family transcriptional regulator [Mammaliicoccus sciuri]PTJ45520.1 PadR family transcriptional regulator [Mammaliicoccus sciuri]PTJ64762.1 PadR family transcriptional regulator [Mammaliicoccus sciuri]RIO04508.1 PadR family transcriptional regulator [Mammaliicoccus sciuri]